MTQKKVSVVIAEHSTIPGTIVRVAGTREALTRIKGELRKLAQEEGGKATIDVFRCEIETDG